MNNTKTDFKTLLFVPQTTSSMKNILTLASLLIISVFATKMSFAQINTPITSSDYFVQNQTGKQQIQPKVVTSGEIKKDESAVATTDNANNGQGPVGYIKCTFDNGSINFNDIVDVAYGANGKFKFMTHVAGTIKFDSKTFGDPIPGVEKAGYYRVVSKK